MPRFTRTHPTPAVRGKHYRRFHPYVRRDFEERCAYCLIPEHWEEAFELDHFRPRPLFGDLVNNFHNLYYACRKCNGYKHDHWPSEKERALGYGFVDLCCDDVQGHFALMSDGSLKGLTPSAEWTIDRIRLNRSHLVTMRRFLFNHFGPDWILSECHPHDVDLPESQLAAMEDEPAHGDPVR